MIGPRAQAGLIAAGAVAALVLGLAAALHLSGWRIGKAEERAEEQTDAAVSSQESLKGVQAVERHADTLRVTVDVAQERTHDLEMESRAAADADAPLPPDSADRLRRHDDFLCGLRPAVCADSRDGAPAADPGPG